jgi:hypothetical protein
MDLASGLARNLTKGQEAVFPPAPQLILDIVHAGGSREWALKRIAAASIEGNGSGTARHPSPAHQS